MKPRVLMITDSMGTDFGAIGYAHVAKDTYPATVDVLHYAGLPAFMVAADLDDRELGSYDVALVQLGVPDITARFPHFIMRGLRKVGLKFIRESFFFTPPNFGWRWILRLPLLLVRLVITRIYRASYTTPEELVALIEHIVTRLRKQAPRVVVLPVFEVSRLYGRDHGRRAREANEKLAATFGADFVRCPALDPSVYGRFRNHDFFHLRDEYHRQLAQELEPILLSDGQVDQRDRLTS
ncbi:MAG TPA: hypothetical protein VG076_02605 [Acidimicrobiales bacterium]|jgi:hypothetical protein|nr:hypothetical protein [Acidimicrobiales bacterium]